jgi:HK97 gp10 family phage protein
LKVTTSLTVKQFGNPVKTVRIVNDETILKTAIKITSQAKGFANFQKGYATGQTKNGIMYRTGTGQEGGLNESAGQPNPDAITPVPRRGQAYVGVNNDHAIYPEFGTLYMTPQPYLTPAINQVVGKKEYEKTAKEISDFWFKRNEAIKKERTFKS